MSGRCVCTRRASCRAERLLPACPPGLQKQACIIARVRACAFRAHTNSPQDSQSKATSSPSPWFLQSLVKSWAHRSVAPSEVMSLGRSSAVVFRIHARASCVLSGVPCYVVFESSGAPLRLTIVFHNSMPNGASWPHSLLGPALALSAIAQLCNAHECGGLRWVPRRMSGAP